jgi:hypothetical protein
MPDQTAKRRRRFQRADPTNSYAVDYTRVWTGMWVIFFGDVAIALAAKWGVVRVSSGHANVESTVSILKIALLQLAL